jgi:o-succinylbenzoate synthase
MDFPPLKLDSLAAYTVRIPLAKPFRISVGEITVKEFVLFEGRCGDASGWGEAAVDGIPFYTSETAGTALLMAQSVLGPLLLSRSWRTPAEFADAAQAYRGHHFTKAALEQVLWDLAGRCCGQPVARLLGGNAAPREWVETGPSLGIHGTPEALVEEVRRELGKGFRRIKLKVAPGHDEAYLAAVRSAFPDAVLMVDANAAYGFEDLDRLAGWDRFGLQMIEQPFPVDDLHCHAQLASRLETPICTDESIESVHATRCAIAMGAADIVNIKVGRVGGLTRTREIHDLCQAANVPVWIGSRIGTTVANAARVVAASLPNATYPTDAAFSSRYLAKDIVVEPMQTKDTRFIRVPTAPGFGFTVDRDELARFTIQKDEL